MARDFPLDFTFPHARVGMVKKGMILQTDGGFTCMPAHARREVKEDDEGLFIDCDCGKHHLDGQISLNTHGEDIYSGLAIDG